MAEIFYIFECLPTQNPTNQDSHSLDSSRPYERLLENQKAGSSRELFLPEMITKLAPQKMFQKKHPDFGGLETNWRHEIQTFFFFLTCHSYKNKF